MAHALNAAPKMKRRCVHEPPCLEWPQLSRLDPRRNRVEEIKEKFADKVMQVSFEILKDLAISSSRSFLPQ